MIKNGDVAPFNADWWDSCNGPLSDEVQADLGLTLVGLPEDPYGPLGLYRDAGGVIWEVIYGEPDRRYQFFRSQAPIKEDK